MDLYARVDVNFARVDVKINLKESFKSRKYIRNETNGPFSNVHCDLILSHFFFILIPINIKVLLRFGDMDLKCLNRRKLFRVDVNFQTAIVT